MLELSLYLKKKITLYFHTSFQSWLYICTAPGSCKGDQFSLLFLYHVQYEFSNGSY